MTRSATRWIAVLGVALMGCGGPQTAPADAPAPSQAVPDAAPYQMPLVEATPPAENAGTAMPDIDPSLMPLFPDLEQMMGDAGPAEPPAARPEEPPPGKNGPPPEEMLPFTTRNP